MLRKVDQRAGLVVVRTARRDVSGVDTGRPQGGVLLSEPWTDYLVPTWQRTD